MHPRAGSGRSVRTSHFVSLSPPPAEPGGRAARPELSLGSPPQPGPELGGGGGCAGCWWALPIQLCGYPGVRVPVCLSIVALGPCPVALIAGKHGALSPVACPLLFAPTAGQRTKPNGLPCPPPVRQAALLQLKLCLRNRESLGPARPARPSSLMPRPARASASVCWPWCPVGAGWRGWRSPQAVWAGSSVTGGGTEVRLAGQVRRPPLFTVLAFTAPLKWEPRDAAVKGHCVCAFRPSRACYRRWGHPER